MIIYFLAVGTYAGSDVGIWHFGTVIVTQCLVVMSIHLAIETKSWTIVHVLSIVLSVAGMEINLYQVWSLSQFYSVDFSKSRIGVKKCVFNKRTIKVCVSCC